MDELKESIYSKAEDNTEDSIINKLRKLLSENANTPEGPTLLLSEVDKEGYTLLEHAISAKRTKLVRFFADRGAKLAPKSPQKPSSLKPELTHEEKQVRYDPLRDFLLRHNWPYTQKQDGVIAFLIFSSVFALFGIFHLTHKAWPTIVAVMLWIGMTMASVRNRHFMRRIIDDFKNPPRPKSRASTQNLAGGKLVVFEGPDYAAVSECIEKVASQLEDVQHLRVVKTVWSRDRVPKFVEKTPGARRPRGFTDKYTRKDKAEKGDIFIVQSEVNTADLADRDTLGFAAQFVDEIRPALEQGSIVLVSHYWYNAFMRYKSRGGQHVDLVSGRFSFVPAPDFVVLLENSSDDILQSIVKNKEQIEYLDNAWKYARDVKPGEQFDDPFADVEEHMPYNFVEAGLDVTMKGSFGKGRSGLMDALRSYFQRLCESFKDVKDIYAKQTKNVVLKVSSSVSVDDVAQQALQAVQIHAIGDGSDYYQEIPALYRTASFSLLMGSVALTIVAVVLEVGRLGGGAVGRVL